MDIINIRRNTCIRRKSTVYYFCVFVLQFITYKLVNPIEMEIFIQYNMCSYKKVEEATTRKERSEKPANGLERPEVFAMALDPEYPDLLCRATHLHHSFEMRQPTNKKHKYEEVKQQSTVMQIIRKMKKEKK
jgi:hypothetical protein